MVNLLVIKHLLLAVMIGSQIGGMNAKQDILCFVYDWNCSISTEASLVSNTSVACPGEAVLFICSKPAVVLRWQVNPPAKSGLLSVQSTLFIGSQVGRRDTFGSGVSMFLLAVLVSNDGGTLTSTLINLSEVSVLEGTNITCTTTNSNGITVAIQQTISVAGE